MSVSVGEMAHEASGNLAGGTIPSLVTWIIYWRMVVTGECQNYSSPAPAQVDVSPGHAIC